MNSLHPSTTADVVELLRTASLDGTRILPVGGRQHIDRGNWVEVDTELWTTQLDGVAAYDPSEMIAVVAAGMRVRDLRAMLAEADQEWVVDAPDDATVGGIIAAGVSSPRRLRVGHVRDTVTELEFVTGDGRLIKSGARTVKNVTGYDIHRLLTGSMGTLGVIVQAAVKVRPRPQVIATLEAAGDGIAMGRALLSAVPAAAMILAMPERVRLRLEGWSDEVSELATLAQAAVPTLSPAEDRLPSPADLGTSIVAEGAVPPSRLAPLVAGRDSWAALVGVGIAWIGVESVEELRTIQMRAVDLGGIAPAVMGPGGLGAAPVVAPQVQRRLKDRFDPAGILAPGRGWPADD